MQTTKLPPQSSTQKGRKDKTERQLSTHDFQCKERTAQGNSVRRSHSSTRPASDQQPALLVRQTPFVRKKWANTAPACFGAPSRPSDTPRPTIITESTALPSVRKAGIRPA